jgi:DNA-binding transcriptional MerR regulator
VKELDINAVAKVTGVPAATLRFYEEKGLIKSIGRSGLRRVFAVNVTERLALIALGRSAGFSLDQIARVFTPDGRTRINRQMLADKATEIDATIKQLTAMRDGQSHGMSDVSSADARGGGRGDRCGIVEEGRESKADAIKCGLPETEKIITHRLPRS